MDEVDILECENLAVCDAYDGEINVFGQQFQIQPLGTVMHGEFQQVCV